MKALYSIPMLIAIVITGIVSCRLFYHSDYTVSALLTVISYVSVALWVALMKDKKMNIQ
jgi:hypothetical protein